MENPRFTWLYQHSAKCNEGIIRDGRKGNTCIGLLTKRIDKERTVRIVQVRSYLLSQLCACLHFSSSKDF